MFYRLWLKRVLFSPRNLFQFSSLFSLFGLVLGVASLTTALLVVEGFSTGLKRSIWDISGHVIVLSDEALSRKTFKKKIQTYNRQIKNHMDFLSFEGLVLKDGNFKGVLLEGIEITELKKNPYFVNRFVQGSLSESEDSLIVGSSLAAELNLQIGSEVLVVTAGPENSSGFSRTQKTFTVGTIANFGRHTLNSRYALMPLAAGQFLKQQSKDRISGTRIWLKDADKAEKTALSLRMKNPSLIVSSWRDVERGFFEVIEMDKKIIFFVLLILVLAAGFNVSGSLFITVFRRTREISILKAIGAGKSLVTSLFLMEGLVLGLTGTLIGMLLGWSLCYGLLRFQTHWNLIPLDVYQVNEIVLSVNSADALTVLAVTLAVSFLASVLPAIRAYNRDVTKGLAWE